MARKRKLSPIEAFQKAARENGMTYGQLQVLETLGKVRITSDGAVIWRK